MESPRALGAIDPRSVPLPHGTEVTTLVDRVQEDGRRVPQGSVGRVTGEGAGRVTVAFPGLPSASFERHEVAPRRVGQAAFALRREEAWRALGGCTVLAARVGSHAWGLADERSDEDERGVFAAPLPWTLGLAPAPDTLVSADGSATLWSFDKCVRQALRADPNTLELLFVPGARALDELGAWLLEARDAFVSTEIHGTFGRYAVAQLRRLEQSARLAEHRGLLLDWLRAEPTLDLDAAAERLRLATFDARGDEAHRRELAKQWIKNLYRSLHDQGLLAACDFAALRAFALERSHAFELPRELRPKNAYNLLRLLWTAQRWLETGAPTFAAPEPFRSRLLAVKRGEVPLDDVLREAEGMLPALDAAAARSPLPPGPDAARADALLRRAGVEIARRWVDRAPGPFGADAPAPPEARP